MNRPLLGRIATFLFLFYALGLAGFCIYAFLGFTANEFLPTFRWEYAVKKGFTLFIDYLLPVHAAAVAVAASLAGTTQAPALRGAEAPPFSRIVSSTIAVFLLLTAAYTVLYEGVYPGARRRLSEMQYQSRLARTYKGQAETAVKAKDFVSAKDAITRYLIIDPKNPDMRDQLVAVGARAAAQAAPRPKAVPVPPIDAGENAQTLVERAQVALARKDWFSAHYYAQAAAALDPRRTDAQRIASQAWDAISGAAAPPTDPQKAEFAQQKKDAYTLLVSGNPLAAYYRFLALKVKYPNDKDIATYLAKAATDITQTTFFLDEATSLETLPGTQDILYVNRIGGGVSEAVSIGKMVTLPDGGAYFYDIEAIRYTTAGAVAWHFSAQYGKRLANAGGAPSDGSAQVSASSILMHAVDRNSPRLQFLPVYLQGARPPAEKDTLLLAPTMEELRALSSHTDALAVMDVTELWRLRVRLGTFGLSRQALTIEMTMKMVMPFIFLVLSMLAVGLGWAFRARARGRVPLASALLVPLVPAVLAVLTLLYVYAHRVITGFVVLAFGLTTAFIVLGALQLVLLAGALVLLAGQSTR